MVRARHNPAKLRRKRRLLKAAKGYWGARKNLQRVTREAVHHAWNYAFRDRRAKKRDFRQLWIARITAACEARGMKYSRFINGLKKAGVTLDRKALAELAIHDAGAFDAVLTTAKSHAPAC
ncbi:MAG: 50S ribosomal protein L20 [Planctomycetes bacterium]|nr:50S ribosomal protein L20 [Planctomycetota bacterium]